MITDYNGFMPDDTPFAELREQMNNARATPIQSLVTDILEESLRARIYVTEHLLKNPGVVATFDDFEVFFGDVKLETDHETLRDLNETRIIITQDVRIRRKDRDDPGTPLGGDPRGEEASDRQDPG